MTNLTPEMIAKAKNTKTSEELIALAKENGIEMTEEEAKTFFAQLNPPSGELSDDELADVAGGGCYGSDGRLIVTILHSCDLWTCTHCGSGLSMVRFRNRNFPYGHPKAYGYKKEHHNYKHCPRTDSESEWVCKNCVHMSYEGAWYCNHPDKRK
ncbi:MAG: Nif11-like leader peptide family RiPP precursor [Clostridia bacterium]|nr:Nif11-like leader peptide family RiPP precursor [Clostridia bacterium]